jgi:ribonuclease D
VTSTQSDTVPDGSAPGEGDGAADAEPEGPTAILLRAPREGIPPLIADYDALAEAATALAGGTGPVAVDAERASGFRYGQRAYLVQLRRNGSGSHLVDPAPAAVPDLSSLGAALEGVEWIIHAANQDLPCLAEVGMRPTALFDTELAGRLLGYERVALAALTERMLGYTLAKEHSASDWSRRPLTEDQLAYASLDVELLVELRDSLADELRVAGKLDWALQEFAAILDAPPPQPRAEPWRRVSGIHRARGRRQLGEVRALWEQRDAIARERDVAPGRILPDAVIMGMVQSQAADEETLRGVQGLSGPRMRRTVPTWWRAIVAARALPDDALPDVVATTGTEGPPASVSRWAERDPEAAARLQRARAALTAVAEENQLPLENLLEPALNRRICWSPPDPLDVASVSAALAAGRARPWQIGLVAEALTAALPG